MMETITGMNQEMRQVALQHIDTLTKPLGSLGRLEELAGDLAGMTGNAFPVVTPPGVLVFAGDHGVVEEGVSAFPQEVTAQMVLNFVHGGAAINVFSRQIGALFEIVNVGVATSVTEQAVVNRHVRFGTANMCNENAMTRAEAEAAITAGYEEAMSIMDRGAKCLVLGEMGIGNTTASSAMLAVFSGMSVEKVIGIGTGISEEQLLHKTTVIKRALRNRMPNRKDPLDVLMKVGGLEIGAMAGAMLAAATRRIPIIVDGFICTVAAILAKELCEATTDYMICGHRSTEQGYEVASAYLGKKPLLDLGLRLGEGSGAAVAFSVVHSASLMLAEMATFQTASISGKDK
ncbi:nicotinate-nucleotide--dimethylbenzimidazole phosphoribosyltransferase [Fictibacillus macauensis]|nr:nicotinate-nucleotide--dimethylbenzimidazole phosphoribosyltransferase [Fictibacillus macauensis]